MSTVRLSLALACLILQCVALDAQQVSPHAKEAVQTIRQLRAIGLPDSRNIASGPPAAVPGLLRQLNQQLRALIVDTLNDKSRHTVPSEADVMSDLRAAGWEEVPDHKWNAYGEIVQINLDWKLGYDPGILVVTTQLWIPCGSSDPDSAIYIFRGRAREWKLVLATDADFDAAGRSPESGLQYQLSPPDSSGNWFLAVANAPPSCRPSPVIVSYKVLRPGRNADEPATLLKGREQVSSQFDPAFRLRTEMDWMALTRGRLRKLDGEDGVSISRYEISLEKARRVPPLALNPLDFLDEWTKMSWGEASRWSNQFVLPDLERWHSRLSKLEDDSTEFQSLALCSKNEASGNNWLLNLWIDKKQNPSSAEANLYITINEENGAYFVEGIRTNRPAGCLEKSLPPQQADMQLPSW